MTNPQAAVARPAKILVVCPNWIGDVVMATPMLRALRKRFPAAHMTALLKPYVAEVLEGGPWFDDLLFHDSKSADRRHHTWPIVRKLRNERFDVGVLLPGSLRSALMTWAGRVRRRVGYAREGRRFFLNDPLPVKQGPDGYLPSPLLDYYLELAYHLGAEPESPRMELFTTADDERRCDALWAKFGFTPDDRVVAINPGAAFGPAKRWPAASFAELARKLVDHQRAKILVMCGPAERGIAQFIADGSLRPRMVRSLADEPVSIGLSKAVVRRSSLLVTTDSGPRHFAAAFGVPAVSLFGPTHIAWTDTHTPLETMLQKSVPCGPCQQRVCPLEHHRCMNELGVDEVLASVRPRLEPAVRPSRGLAS
ncbi:MAG: lipopolysaccharide heptosyltransferase II [Planctomycetia bacterium]